MMPPRLLHPDEYELVTRSSLDSRDSFDLDEADFESHASSRHNHLRRNPPLLNRLLGFILFAGLRLTRARPRHAPRKWRGGQTCRRRFSTRRICFLLSIFIGV